MSQGTQEIALPGIGIRGDAGAGKDTLAAFLVRNNGFYRRAFADALKEEVGAILFPFTAPEFLVKRVDMEKHKPEMREFLQAYGVAMRVFVHQDYWVNKLFEFLAHKRILNPIVVPDVRFPNEIEALRSKGVPIVEVRRNEDAAKLTGNLRKHVSERALDGIPADFVVTNDGTPEEMYEQFLDILAVFLHARRLSAVSELFAGSARHS